MLKQRGPVIARMLKGEEAAVTFPIEGCIKDLQSMQAEGRARGLSLPLVQMTLACMEASASTGIGAKESAMHSVYWSKT
jgi:3-hydroxyisobutyrate dehydrogenase-like beta-hydroxyacid dehydrogenase